MPMCSSIGPSHLRGAPLCAPTSPPQPPLPQGEGKPESPSHQIDLQREGRLDLAQRDLQERLVAAVGHI